MFGRKAKAKHTAQAGFLTRLRRDTRGNTLAMVAAAIIPMLALIGGGLDMSRAYMAKSRLQAACDAASLAARRVMTNDTLSANVITEGRRFFNFNFPQGTYQTTAFTPDVTRPETGTVRVTASTEMPTTIMQIFGYDTLPLDVDCDATMNFINTDIVLVLDVTGSMLCTPSEPGTCGRTSEISTSRIVALRDAVMALYDQLEPVQDQLESQGLRLRYGVVPFSSNVNVGHLLRDVNPNFIRASGTYSSRAAKYTTAVYVLTGSVDGTPVSETYGSSITQDACLNGYGRHRNYPSTDGPGPFTISGSPGSGTQTTRYYTPRDWGGTGTADRSGSTRTCRRWRTDTVSTYRTEYGFTPGSFRYQTVEFDTTALRTGNTIFVAGGHDSAGSAPGGTYTTNQDIFRTEQQMVSAGASATAINWDGCIEERDTVNTITGSSGYNAPSGAYDLNINLIPNSDATRWRPFLPDLIWLRSGTSSTSTATHLATAYADTAGWVACPSEARRLDAMERDDLVDYVDSLRAVGGTYHDIGMIWGARLISSGGVFSDSPDVFAGVPVSRHIIYMTDGELAPNNNSYSAYGIERSDRRVTSDGNSTSQYNSHLQRFRMICNAVKNNDTSVWVIAFATVLTTDMQNCASNADQASTSTNRDQLIARFRQIGERIGALRLVE